MRGTAPPPPPALPMRGRGASPSPPHLPPKHGSDGTDRVPGPPPPPPPGGRRAAVYPKGVRRYRGLALPGSGFSYALKLGSALWNEEQRRKKGQMY